MKKINFKYRYYTNVRMIIIIYFRMEKIMEKDNKKANIYTRRKRIQLNLSSICISNNSYYYLLFTSGKILAAINVLINIIENPIIYIIVYPNFP